MKVLIAVEEGTLFIYYKSAIMAFCKRGHEVVFLVAKSLAEETAKEIETLRKTYPKFSYAQSYYRAGGWRQKLQYKRVIANYRHMIKLTSAGYVDKFYAMRLRKYFPGWLYPFVYFNFLNANFLIKTDFVKRYLDKIEASAPPDAGIVAQLKELKPDIVIVTNGNVSSSTPDYDYIAMSAHLGIPCVQFMVSWDGLETKGYIHKIPDKMFLWNEIQKRTAVEKHGIPPDRIQLVGSPFYDAFYAYAESIKSGPKSYSPDRAAFCAKYGLDPKRPILMYMSSTPYSGDLALLQDIRKYFDESGDQRLKNVQILARSHPAVHKFFKGVSSPPGLAVQNGEVPRTDEAVKFFYESLHHSMGVAGICTSGLFLAFIADKPVVTIIDNRFKRIQLNSPHFRQLVEENVMEVAEGKSGFLEIVLKLLSGADDKKGIRADFVKKYIRPQGIPAGEALADAAEQLVKEKKHI